MKKITIIISFFFTLSFNVPSTYGQTAGSYIFTASSGTFTPITGATSVSEIQADSKLSVALPIGFSFVYAGVSYTELKASSNSFLTFDTASTDHRTINDLEISAPIIAPFWDDNDGKATGGSTASYLVTGTAPNRVFTFEWLNWEWRFDSSDPVISAQVKLHETSDKIEFIYQSESGAITGSANASVGLSMLGTGSGTFLSISGFGASPTTSTSTENSSIETKPASGQVYTFVPISVNSIVRQTPTAENTSASQVTFRVTFNDDVLNVDTTDFSLTVTETALGTVNSVTKISDAIYDVTVNNISGSGTLELKIKGVGGAANTNDIIQLNENLSVNITGDSDYLTQSKIGQTFTATTSGTLTKVTFFTEAGVHTFSGTANLQVYSGEENDGGTLLSTESINLTNSTAASGQSFRFTTPQSVTAGNTYSIILDTFNGSGIKALTSQKDDLPDYTGGYVIFTGQGHEDYDLKIQIFETPPAAATNLSSSGPANTESYIKEISWLGTTTDWATASNWSSNAIPLTTDNIVIPNITNKPIINNGATAVANNIRVEASSSLTIESDGALILDGNLTQNGTFTINSSATNAGSLIVKGSSTGNIIYKRGGLIANEWYVITPPVSRQTIKTFAENTDNDIRINTTPDPDRYAIANYNDALTAGNRWVYYDANLNATDEFIAGQSYSMSRATNGNFTFTGTLTVGDLTKTLIAGQWNAIGNPFTTYYPANKNSSSSFLNDNIGVLDANFPSIYLWDDTQNKYIAVTELDATNRSLPPGQGFFIKMKAAETEIAFNKAKRSVKPSSGTTTFSKTEATRAIKLQVSKEKTTVSTDIKYFENATIGFDAGFEIGNFNSTGLDMYSRLVDNSNTVNYTIQSLPTNNYENMIVAIGVQAKKDDAIAFNQIATNLPEGVNVYLEDRQENKFINLTNLSDNYSLTIDKDLNGIGRFYLHTSSKVLSTADVNDLENIKLFYAANNINIKGLQTGRTNLKIFSIAGQQILNTKFEATGNDQIHLPSFAKGIYMVDVTNSNNTISKKIIIE